jgi:hypothetical protein
VGEYHLRFRDGVFNVHVKEVFKGQYEVQAFKVEPREQVKELRGLAGEEAALEAMRRALRDDYGPEI